MTRPFSRFRMRYIIGEILAAMTQKEQSPMLIPRPQSNEYFEYYDNYIKRVPDGDVLAILEGQIQRVRDALLPLSNEQALYRFGDGEWSIKQCMGHINDAEQLFAFRMFSFSRNEPSPLPSFDQDIYITQANYDDIALPDLVAQFEHMRRAHLLMIRNFAPEMLSRRGVASGYEFSVRALVYILGGHVEHHLISLAEDYGVKF